MSRSLFTSWIAFQKARKLANWIFKLSTSFPREERYSLTDQIRRSSRSVCANMAESYGKRRYPRHFTAKLTDCIGENYETQTWLMFALDHQYISQDQFRVCTDASEEVGRLLSYMIANPEKFTGPYPTARTR